MCAELLEPGRPAVVGLDAPLGWPRELGRLLENHRAGDAVGIDGDRLFRRRTDEVVREYLGKQPLEVGADRIARTAVVALDLLGELRELTGRDFPVAVRHRPELCSARSAALEVYPAGLLIAWGGSAYARGYRGTDRTSRTRRAELLADLAHRVSLTTDPSIAVEKVDVLDALLCVVAVDEVLSGHATAPHEVGADNPDLERGGWMWLPLTGAGSVKGGRS
jgi:hypothetical protein